MNRDSVAALRICNRCGWAHFPVTRQFAETKAREALAFMAAQTPEVQEQFGVGPLSELGRLWSFSEHVAEYDRCFRCSNPYKKFHDLTDADYVPIGCTMSGIITD